MQTILFLHGWGGNADSFAPISQYFAGLRSGNLSQYQIISPSLPCPPQTVYTLDDYADDVDLILQKNQVTRCIVFAHSFGARLVAVLQARHPKLFTQIIITGGAGLPTRKSLPVRIKIRFYKICRKLGLNVSGGSADYRILDEKGQQTFRNIVNRDLSFEIAQITAPTLLIWGSKDHDTPLGQMCRWQKLIPHAEQIIYRGKGHFAYLEDTARFINDVNRFLRSNQ